MAIITIKDKNGNLIDIPALQGQNGKSAYEYAKEQGFTGTEEEFAQTLVKTPLATNTTTGVVQGYTYYGHTINSSGAIMHQDPTTQIIDSRRNFYPVTTSTIDYATKAALTDGVGAAWTDEEKASAKERLGVVDTPVATKSSLGIVGVNASMGIDISNVNGTIYVAKATDEQIDARTNEYKPIVPKNLDYAVKSALCDGKGAEWTEEEKSEARKRIGIDGDLLIKETIILEEDLVGAMSIELPTPCEQVFMLVKQPINTTSIALYSGIIFEDQYSTGAGNLMNSATTKPNGYVSYKLTLLDNGIVEGVTSNSSGVVNQIHSQFTDQIGKKIAKVGLSSISATLPKGTEIIVFGGNKSVNISSSSDSNGVTDVTVNGASIVADGVADIPIANTWNKLGIVKCGNGYGLKVSNSGELSVDVAQISNIDNRTVGARLITTERLDYAVKAAMTDGKGDEWTPEEKTAAKSRMGVNQWELIAESTLEQEVGYWYALDQDTLDKLVTYNRIKVQWDTNGLENEAAQVWVFSNKISVTIPKNQQSTVIVDLVKEPSGDMFTGTVTVYNPTYVYAGYSSSTQVRLMPTNMRFDHGGASTARVRVGNSIKFWGCN